MPTDDFCMLIHWAPEHGYGYCGGGIQHHHLISKNLLRNNPQGRKLVDEVYPYLFIAPVCAVHNAETKCADLMEARLFMLRHRRRQYPEIFEQAFEELIETFKCKTDIEAIWNLL